MADRKAYTSSFSWHMLSITFLFLLFLISPSRIIAQDEPEYDEILVFLEIPKIGGFEIPAVIRGDQLYLPVTDLFEIGRAHV